MIRILAFALAMAAPTAAVAQQAPHYQSEFSAADFDARHAVIAKAIGPHAIALVPAAPDPGDLSLFRQANDFYYLSGIEVPNSYLTVDGASGRTTLYLPHRNVDRDGVEGPMLALEDRDQVIALTGVEDVKPLTQLPRDLAVFGFRSDGKRTIFTPFQPIETVASRDTMLFSRIARMADPFDGGDNREGRLREALAERYPALDIDDLSPTLDRMRLIKSDKEIALIREASRIAGEGIVASMRATRPGLMEYELDAVSKFTFARMGARGEAYASIIGGGQNGYYGHYWRKSDPLEAGDMILYDHAPDYRYYTSDVTRMWPVSGEYTPLQRHVADFILAYRDALNEGIRPGVTSNEVLDGAAAKMARWLERRPFTDPAYAKAAADALDFRGHFQHGVGLAVHDVGTVRGVELQPGMVFTIDPMMWVHDQRLYFRIEDVILVTEDGFENLSAFVPATPDDIEATIAQPGIL